MPGVHHLTVDVSDDEQLGAVASTSYLRSTMLPTLSPVRTLEQLPSPSTRYGKKSDSATKFGTEERFRKRNTRSSSDVMYSLPTTMSTHTVLFGSGGRTDLTAKSSNGAGPASYDITRAHYASSATCAKPGKALYYARMLCE